MNYVLRGVFDGEEHEVRWQDGKVESDDERIMALLRYRERQGHRSRLFVTPTGPIIYADLSDPVSVYVHAIDIFDSVLDEQGVDDVMKELVRMSTVPPGAVA